jgi:hypothetical protein
MNPATGLSVGRIAIGVVALASPPIAGKLFRLDSVGNPQLPDLSRMFGSREIALGAATLVASGAARRNLVVAGIAVDAADAVSGFLAARDGLVDKPTGAFLTAPALAAVAAGVAGLRG